MPPRKKKAAVARATKFRRPLARAQAQKLVAPPRINFEADPDDKLCTSADVCDWLGCSAGMIYKLLRVDPPDGLPQPIRLGSLKRWRLGTLRKWMRERDERAAGPHLVT